MYLTSIIVVFFFAVISMAAPQSSYEMSCRAKAKEIATESYRTCVTQNKTAEIEKLKKDYQERLRNLKDDYENEVTKLGLKKSKKLKQKKVETDDSQMDLPEPIPVEIESQGT